MMQFEVYSAMYGKTDAVIGNLEHAIKQGYCITGDGEDYRITKHEMDQLKSPDFDEDNFISSYSLGYPMNLIALLIPIENRLLIPQNFRFTSKQFKDVKAIMMKSNGKYNNNSYVFEDETGEEVYNRITSGHKYYINKELQFYFTKDETADWIINHADIHEYMDICEPSAGKGHLVKAIQRVSPNHQVLCFEKHEPFHKYLNEIPNVKIIGTDFLNKEPLNIGPVQFDRIIANPPFTRHQDIIHIRHMYDWYLRRGGKIASVASNSWKSSNQKIAKDFRLWLNEVKAEIIEMDKDSFKGNGSNVSTCLIIINKPTWGEPN